MEIITLEHIAGYLAGSATALTIMLCGFLWIKFMTEGKIFD